MSKIVDLKIKIDKDLKESATILAEKMGTDLSGILNMYLVKFTFDNNYKKGNFDDLIIDNFTDEEVLKLESLSNFNNFMSSIKGK